MTCNYSFYPCKQCGNVKIVMDRLVYSETLTLYAGTCHGCGTMGDPSRKPKIATKNWNRKKGRDARVDLS